MQSTYISSGLFYSILFEDKQWKRLLIFCKILWLLQVFSQNFHFEIDYEL